MKIGFVTHHPRSEYWAMISYGVKEHAKARSVDLLLQPTEDIEQQIEAIELFIRQGVDALLVGPRARIGLGNALGHAKAQGIPVVVIDNRMFDFEADAIIEPDNVGGGVLIAHYLAEQLGGRGRVVHLAGPAAFDSAGQRADGVRQGFAAFSEITLVYDQPCASFSEEDGFAAMQQVLASGITFDAVCAANDLIALAALRALEVAGYQAPVLITGYDGIPEALVKIKEGQITATVLQPMDVIGHTGLQTAIDLVQGLPVVAHTFVPNVLIEPNNLVSRAFEMMDTLPGLMQNVLETADTLERERRYLQTLINALPNIAAYIKDHDGRYLLANQTMAQRIGIPAEAMLGRTDPELGSIAAQQHSHSDDLHAMAQAVESHEVVEFLDGSQTRWLSNTRIPLRNLYNQVIGVIGMSQDITSFKQAEFEQARLREAVIAAQEALLRELSSPLIPISKTAVVMPLIGAIDSRRAQQMIESLLSGVGQTGARLAIIDITGVSIIDTQVANAFIQAAQAVKLLGAQVILSGIRPEVAQTLVSLGVNLRDMLTLSTLQAAVAFAFQQERQG